MLFNHIINLARLYKIRDKDLFQQRPTRVKSHGTKISFRHEATRVLSTADVLNVTRPIGMCERFKAGTTSDFLVS